MTSLRDATYFVIDTETTGLDPATGGVCEFALAVLKNGRITFKFSSLVNPGAPIPPETSAIHHITDKHVEGYGNLDDILRQCARAMAEAGVSPTPPDAYVAHNARFDSSFVPQLNKAPWLCTFRWAQHIWPDSKMYSNQYLRYALQLEVPEVEGLAAHRAMADVYVTASLLNHLIDQALYPEQDVGELIAAIGQPILKKTCRFKAHDGKPWSEVPKEYLKWLINNLKDLDPDTLYTIQYYLQ